VSKTVGFFRQVFSPQTPQKGSFGVPTINTTPFTNGSRKLRVTLGGMAYGALSPEEEELRRAEMQYEQAKRCTTQGHLSLFPPTK
jgi:hypothetical protein